MAEKKDIIMQLRALERAPKQKIKEFDPTEVVDHGLLDQMSLVELRARLEFVKAVQKEEEERMRQKIARTKGEREMSLNEKVANIERIRKLAAAQAQARRDHNTQERIEREQKLAEHLRQTKLFLDQKLAAKRAVIQTEKQRLAAEEKQMLFEQFQDEAELAAAEELRLREMATSPRIDVSTRQAAQMASMDALTNARMKREYKKLSKQKLKSKKDFLKAYDERLKQLAVEAATSKADDVARRATTVAKRREFEVTQKAEHRAHAYKPFSSSSTNMRARLQALAQGLELEI